ncbi:MAG: AraC family transcriptional regulator [Polyangiales bacterium]
MAITITAVRGLIEELELRGHSTEEFCASVDLDPTLLEDPNETIPHEQFERILDRFAGVVRDPNIGLHIGTRIPTTGGNVIGYLVQAASTLREASALFGRYYPLLVDDRKFAIDLDEDVATISYENSAVPEAHRRHDAEGWMTMIVRMARIFVASFAPIEVRFRHPAPRDASEHGRVFLAPVRFGMPRNEIVFDADLLDIPQKHGDPNLVEILKRRADELLAARDAKTRLPSRVRDLVRSSDRPSAVDTTAVAGALGLTGRTLRRHLAQQGTTFRDVAEDVLREMACESLADPNVPIKEIAYRLGFSEPSTFHRAFKRWTGTTPASFRANARRGAA